MAPTQLQQTRRRAYNKATRLNKADLKAKTANVYSKYLQQREVNPNRAKILKQRLTGYRHRLTQELLGGSAGSGFNPGLSVKGQRKNTRDVLRAKLGNRFNAYYFTKDKARNAGNGPNSGPNSVGAIKPPNYTGPQPTSKYPGGRIGPPKRR